MVHGKSVAVLGGNGFIGSNLVADLGCTSINKNNYHIHEAYDVLINANGNSNKQLPESKPLDDFDLTVRNTMKSILDFKYQLFIYISSCEISPHEDYIPTNLSRYALSKYLAELIVKKYCPNWLIIRLNGPIGPGMKKGPIYDIMNEKQLWISSESRFQLIHTKYISQLISTLLSRGISNEVINLTGHSAITLKEVMSLFGKIVKSPDEPIIYHHVDITKVSRLISIPSSTDAVKELLLN